MAYLIAILCTSKAIIIISLCVYSYNVIISKINMHFKFITLHVVHIITGFTVALGGGVYEQKWAQLN